MRVIDSPKLWDNYLRRKKRSASALSIYVCTLLVLSSVISGLVVERYYHGRTVALPVTDEIKPLRQVLAARTINKQQLLPEQDSPAAALLREMATISHKSPVDCATMACIALTFDDGPDPLSTPAILEVLHRERVKGSFFLIGNRMSGNAGIVQRMHDEGNDIGNHSWAHPDFTRLTPAQMQEQIDLTQNAITMTGVPTPHIFRPPYGSFKPAMLNYVNLPVILWNVDPKDWADKDSNHLAQAIESQARPGAIIVMHDKLQTVAAMSKVIPYLKTKYRLVTVTQLLNLQPGVQGIFIGR